MWSEKIGMVVKLKAPLGREGLDGLHLLCLRFFDEFNSSNHGRGSTPFFDVIVVEDEIDVNNGEDDEYPHHHMMPLSNSHIATH